MIALGHHISAVMSNHNPLAHELVNASEQSSDRAWRLPLADEYHEQLKSPFADMATLVAAQVAPLLQLVFCLNLLRNTTGHT